MADQYYCVKCKQKRDLNDSHVVTMKNGKPALKGQCAVCGTTVNAILPAAKAEKIEEAEHAHVESKAEHDKDSKAEHSHKAEKPDKAHKESKAEHDSDHDHKAKKADKAHKESKADKK